MRKPMLTGTTSRSLGYVIMAVGMIFFFVNIGWSLFAGEGSRQSVGRRRDDARMDAVEPAAVPQFNELPRIA